MVIALSSVQLDLEKKRNYYLHLNITKLSEINLAKYNKLSYIKLSYNKLSLLSYRIISYH
jgi:hypothetical protein